VKGLAIVIAVLSYNVHGLDRLIVDDDPEARMPAISARLNAYEVALIQESWTYWDALAAHDTHPVRERGNGPDPGTFFQTGLVSFRAALGLRDSAARAADNGRFAHKHIDYILYREGPGVALAPVEVGEAPEFSNGPAPLSDHPAIFARLRVAPASGP
jgi:hypothetical protein